MSRSYGENRWRCIDGHESRRWGNRGRPGCSSAKGRRDIKRITNRAERRTAKPLIAGGVIALLLLLACPAFAAPPTLVVPAEVKAARGSFVVIEAETDSAWVNFRASPGLSVFPSKLLAIKTATAVTAVEDGVYTIWAYVGNEEGGTDREIRVVIGTPPVVVIPPGPGPEPPKPEPPVVSGKRNVLIIRESAADDAATARLLIALRNGEHAAYLASKGHRLFQLDDDDKTPLVESWRPHFTGMKLPAVFILDDKGRLVHKQECPMTAAAVIELVKAKGG